MNHVLAFGTFDLLHPGHRWFLRRAKRLGDHLTVVVSRDRNVRRLKGHSPVQRERARREAVARLPDVNRSILAMRDPRRRYSLIRRLKPNLIALGYDQTHYTENLEVELHRRGIRCKVVRLPAFQPKRYKSTLLRRRLAKDHAS